MQGGSKVKGGSKAKPFKKLVLNLYAKEMEELQDINDIEICLSSEREKSVQKKKERFKSITEYEKGVNKENRKSLTWLQEDTQLNRNEMQQEQKEKERGGRLKQITRCQTQHWDNKYILMINLRKFISKLKQSAVIDNSRWLKDSYLSYIDDKSGQGLNQETAVIKYSTYRPDGVINNIRRHVQLIALLSSVFYFPLTVAFSWSICMEYLVCLVLLEAIYVQGIYTDCLKVIWQNYIGYGLLSDGVVLGCKIGIGWVGSGGGLSAVLRLSVLVRVGRVQELYQIVTERLRREDRWRGVIQLLQLLVMVFFLSHLAGCMMILTAYGQNGQNWLSESGIMIDQQEWQQVYAVAIYWAIVTITTVGYGDVSPVTVLELILVSMTVLLGSASFAFFMNSVGVILADMNRADRQFQQQLDLVNNYMTANHIDSHLQNRVRQYLRHVLKIENATRLQEERESIEQLDPRLKEDVIIQTNARVVHNCALLTEEFSEGTLRRLVLGLTTHRLLPGDSIHLGRDRDCPRFYFIDKGSVSLCLFGQLDRPFLKMGQGEYFGHQAFFSGQLKEETVVSTAFSSLFSISREQFIGIVRLVPEDRQKFQLLQDQLIQGDYKVLRDRCASCFSKNHHVFYCPFVHYVPDKEKIVKSYLFPHEQKRKEWKRRSKRSFNSRFISQELSLISKYYFMPVQIQPQIKNIQMDDIDEATEFSSDDQQSSQNGTNCNRQSLIMNRKPSFKSTHHLLFNIVNAEKPIHQINVNDLSAQELQQHLINYNNNLNSHKRNSVSLANGFQQKDNNNQKQNQQLIDEIQQLKQQLNENKQKIIQYEQQDFNRQSLQTQQSTSNPTLKETQDEQLNNQNIDMIKHFSVYFPENNFENVKNHYDNFCKIIQRQSYQKNKIQLYKKLNYSNQLYEFKQINKVNDSKRVSTTEKKTNQGKFLLKKESDDTKEEFDFKKMLSEVKKNEKPESNKKQPTNLQNA